MIPQPITSYYNALGHWDLEKMVARDRRREGSSTMYVEGGILKCKSNAIDERSYTFHNIFVPTGGWVEVEFMAKAVSGEGDFYVGVYDKATFVSDNEQDSIKITDRNWRPYRMQCPAEQGLNYARLLLGLGLTTIGEVWFKNIVIKGYNMNPQPDLRFAAIKGSKSSWSIDDGVGSYANEGVLAVVLKTDYLEVEFVPFNTWSKPLFTVQILRDNNTGNWGAAIGTQTLDSERKCRIYFVKPTTADVMDPRDATEDLTVIFEAKSR